MRNMLGLYGGGIQHRLPVEPFQPMPFEGDMPYNWYGGGKFPQQFNPMPFDPGRGMPFPNKAQPTFNPIPFEGNMGGQKGVPWWMNRGQNPQMPFNPEMFSQNFSFGFPMRNSLRGFGGQQY